MRRASRSSCGAHPTLSLIHILKNIRFYRDDAGRFLQGCAADGIGVDVLLMDPPRAGSSEEFLNAAAMIDVYKRQVCVFVILIAGLASYALVRYKFKGSALLNSLVVAAMMFPVFSTIIPVFRMEHAWGLAGTNSVPAALTACILPQIAGNLAFAVVVLSGYIKGLPVELEEAAYLEGCNAYQIFFKIIMPLTKPSFATVGIFSFLWSCLLYTSFMCCRTRSRDRAQRRCSAPWTQRQKSARAS